MLYSPVEGDFLRICGKWVAFSFGSWYNQCEWKRSLTAGQIGICRGYTNKNSNDNLQFAIQL